MLKHILLVGLLSFSSLPLLKAQSCGNDEKYHLPYKNTYVKEPLVRSKSCVSCISKSMSLKCP